MYKLTGPGQGRSMPKTPPPSPQRRPTRPSDLKRLQQRCEVCAHLATQNRQVSEPYCLELRQPRSPVRLTSLAPHRYLLALPPSQRNDPDSHLRTMQHGIRDCQWPPYTGTGHFEVLIQFQTRPGFQLHCMLGFLQLPRQQANRTSLPLKPESLHD